MNATTDLIRSNSLADLAARIRTEHAAVGAAMKRGLEHAMAAGDLLLEAKGQLKHGQWTPWLRENCSIPERTAQLYMRLARERFRLEGESATVADLTVRSAVALLAMPKQGRFIVAQFCEVGAHGQRPLGPGRLACDQLSLVRMIEARAGAGRDPAGADPARAASGHVEV